MIETYRRSIANYLSAPAEHITLFWKGRVALYCLLKAFDIKEGDEVILPAFTCVVVPNTIIYLGAKPVYVDIDPLTYNMDLSKMEKAITKYTKIILAQNTFGLSPDMDLLLGIAQKNLVKVIEDCTHGMGGTYKGQKNGTIADASFFSTQWNKPYSTGLGGMAFVKDPVMAEKMSRLEQECSEPSINEKFQLRILLFLKEKILSSFLYWTIVKTYRVLSKKNIVVGSSQGGELDAPVLPATFMKKLSALQAKKGNYEISKLDRYTTHRIRTAKKYHALLTGLNIVPPFEPEYAVHTFLKYPLLVKNRSTFQKLAEHKKIELGDWFESPLHPILKGFERWQYHLGSNPTAEFISAHIVNLPTHIQVNEHTFNRIADFITTYKEHLLQANKL